MKTKYIGLALVFSAVVGYGVEPDIRSHPQFLGPASCSSTGCHGGAGEKNNQNLVWSKHDFHSRSYATLTSARSERFAEILKLGDATKSQRCTVCHAPFHAVEEKLRQPDAKPVRGVSCESCHAPAENWLRSHTRPDFTHEDRVLAGLRDLKNLYVRANTCVACHQTLDQDLARAGHPELIFELDGQCVSQPRHWVEENKEAGPQAWFVGQAVALRELSWQLSREKSPDDTLVARWQGLLWLMQKVSDVNASWPNLSSLASEANPESFTKAKSLCDSLAKSAAEIQWTKELTQRCLEKLGNVAPDFEDGKVPAKVQARRAERLALAYDRLNINLSKGDKSESAIKNIFQLVQSLPDFDSRRFATAIRQFSNSDLNK